jgi:7-keto-8-aminopelargonate synthetase-like enzyme
MRLHEGDVIMSDAIIHVSITNATAAEQNEVRDYLEDALEDYAGNGKIIVTDDNYSIREVPALDEYVDELAEAIAERMGDTEQSQTE